MKVLNQEILQLVQSLFKELSEIELQKEIAEVGMIKEIQEGEVLMNFGSYIKLVPLLVSGSIKVVREDEEDGRELLLYYINPGETCSLSFSCCLTNKKSDIRTTAEDDTKMIVIPVKYVDEWMTKYQSWKRFVMRSYDNRMREMIKTIDSISFKKMDERLLVYLKQRSEVHQSKIIHSTHQAIADDLNASRESISRMLKQLEHQGIVSLERNKIQLL